MGRVGVGPIPPLDPQHPQHARKYEVNLVSNPQQKPQQARHRDATLGASSIERFGVSMVMTYPLYGMLKPLRDRPMKLEATPQEHQNVTILGLIDIKGVGD